MSTSDPQQAGVTGSHSTLRGAGLSWWDAAVCIVGVFDATVLAATSAGALLAVGIAALALMTLVWVIAGRRVPASPLPEPARTMRHSERPRAVAQALTFALVVCVLTFVHPMLAITQAVAYPYVWTRLESIGSILLANASIAAATTLGTAAGLGWTADAWASALASGGLSLLFSLAMGTWITRIAAEAAKRGQLVAQLDEANSEVARLQRESGAAAERERFSRELHDTLTQTLAGVVMLAEQGRKQTGSTGTSSEASPATSSGASSGARPAGAELAFAAVEDAARQALAEARTLVMRGRAPGIDEDGLAGHLHRITRQFQEQTGVTAEAVIASGIGPIDRDNEVVLLRAAQETLSNVRRHAHASRVRLTLAAADGMAVLSVADDGAGIPGGADAALGRQAGLQGLRRRVDLAGGTLRVESEHGRGTQVSVAVPTRVAS